MAKEWILNSATNRFQFNFSRNVGKVSEEIRRCAPRTLKEWEEYYFSNVRSRNHLDNLGRQLYVKITEVIVAEIEDVSEEDCIHYIRQLVLDRTFDGYQTEIRTIYGQLEEMLGVTIEPAPDELDRRYNVDFVIRAGDHTIGIQIKPASDVSHIPEIYKERTNAARTHNRFQAKFGGKVFYVISMKVNGIKVIQNPEVVDDIRREIERLTQ